MRYLKNNPFNHFSLILSFFLFFSPSKTSFGAEINLEALDQLWKMEPKKEEGPEIFSPGRVSSKDQEHSSLAFSPQGDEIWWSLWPLPHDMENKPQVIKYIKFENGQWSKVKTAPFSGTYRDGGPAFSPDGNRIYFYSRRPGDNIDLWYADRKGRTWGEAVHLGPEINTEHIEAAPSVAANGNLYFISNRGRKKDKTKDNDIFLSKYAKGGFSPPVRLPSQINTDSASESFPFIDPGECYILFSRDTRKFNEKGEKVSGLRKIMISFKDDSGDWTEAVDLGKEFHNARFPSVSPDKKAIFITKYTQGGNEDFYRIDYDIINQSFPFKTSPKDK